jgi:hypothetical protein
VTVDVQNVATPPTITTLLGAATIFTHPDTNVAGDAEAFAVTASASGSLANFHVYLDAPLPSSLIVGLYSDSAGAPGTLLATVSLSSLALGWNDFGFGPIALTSGVGYWVALLVPASATGSVNFRDNLAAPSLWYSGHALTSLPAAWPARGVAGTAGPVAAYGTS